MNSLRLLSLPIEVIKLIETQKLTSGHAKILVGLENASFVASKILEKIANSNNNSNISDLQKYKWQPYECSLLDWNGHQFCSLLGDRKIMIVGDSTMMQAGVTLLNRLVDGNAPCVQSIKLVRSDALSRPTMHPACSSNDQTFVDMMNLVKPNISIFSVGSHL